jgi:hypothetical protein
MLTQSEIQRRTVNLAREHDEFMEKLNAKHERMRSRNRIWLYIGVFLIAVWLIGSIVLRIFYPEI